MRRLQQTTERRQETDSTAYALWGLVAPAQQLITLCLRERLFVLQQTVNEHGIFTQCYWQVGGLVAEWLAQGRLNQWAHWARAQGPRIFFSFSGAPNWLWWIKFFLN